MAQIIVAQPVVQSQPSQVEVNPDNIWVVNEFSLFKNLYGGALVKFDSLASMPSVEDAIPIMNNLQDLQ